MSERYRRRVFVVEAEQWYPGCTMAGVEPYTDKDPRVFAEMMDALVFGDSPDNYGWIWTAEGGSIVATGDWVVTAEDGAQWVYKPERFAKLFERVHEGEETP